MYRYFKTQTFPLPVRRSYGDLYPVCMGSMGASRSYEVRPRVMKDYYFVYVLRGKGMFHSMGLDIPLKQHDLFLLFPGVVHAYETDPEDLMEAWWIGFHGARAAHLAEAAGLTPETPLCHLETVELQHILLQMVRDSETHGETAFLSLCGSLYRLFGSLMDRTSSGSGSLPGERAVANARDYISVHYPQPISVEDVAAFVGLSRAALAYKFKRTLGKSPSRVLEEVRLRHGADLLRTTSLSVAEVAHSVGYPDALYFSRVFSRAYGCAPTVYRRES